jgi:hypothetical protein
MVKQSGQKFVPVDADDCLKFVAEHREEIARGVYDLQLEKSWASALAAEDLLLVARHCPSARPAAAAVSKAADLLTMLATDTDASVREAVGDNLKTPAQTLAMLAEDASSSVRMAAASNINTPTACLEKLAVDPVDYVRWGVASNEKSPPTILKSLTKDPDFHVRNQAKSNPSTPKSGFFARLIGRG